VAAPTTAKPVSTTLDGMTVPAQMR
jgi:hypothetical protein